jgi:hypothetical protein
MRAARLGGSRSSRRVIAIAALGVAVVAALWVVGLAPRGALAAARERSEHGARAAKASGCGRGSLVVMVDAHRVCLTGRALRRLLGLGAGASSRLLALVTDPSLLPAPADTSRRLTSRAVVRAAARLLGALARRVKKAQAARASTRGKSRAVVSAMGAGAAHAAKASPWVVERSGVEAGALKEELVPADPWWLGNGADLTQTKTQVINGHPVGLKVRFRLAAGAAKCPDAAGTVRGEMEWVSEDGLNGAPSGLAATLSRQFSVTGTFTGHVNDNAQLTTYDLIYDGVVEETGDNRTPGHFAHETVVIREHAVLVGLRPGVPTVEANFTQAAVRGPHGRLSGPQVVASLLAGVDIARARADQRLLEAQKHWRGEDFAPSNEECLKPAVAPASGSLQPGAMQSETAMLTSNVDGTSPSSALHASIGSPASNPSGNATIEPADDMFTGSPLTLTFTAPNPWPGDASEGLPSRRKLHGYVASRDRPRLFPFHGATHAGELYRVGQRNVRSEPELDFEGGMDRCPRVSAQLARRL